MHVHGSTPTGARSSTAPSATVHVFESDLTYQGFLHRCCVVSDAFAGWAGHAQHRDLSLTARAELFAATHPLLVHGLSAEWIAHDYLERAEGSGA